MLRYLPFANEIWLKLFGLATEYSQNISNHVVLHSAREQLGLGKVLWIYSFGELCCHLTPPYHKATQNYIIFLVS